MKPVLVRKNLNRWFKEKWVDVSRKDKDGKHPPCGRSKAKTSSKGYPKCRPSVKVSSKTPKTSGSMSEGQKQAATKRKRSKKQGVGGKPTIVKYEPEFGSKVTPDYTQLLGENAGYNLPFDDKTPLKEIHDFYAPQLYPDMFHPDYQGPTEKDYGDDEDYMSVLHQEAYEDVLNNMPGKYLLPHYRHAFSGFSDEFVEANKSEPMEIAWRLLKYR